MNLQKLFEAQAELDAYIEQQHPTQPGENRLEKKALALLVELGECANEWRGFKFWSNNQEPNNGVCGRCNNTGTYRWSDPIGNEYEDTCKCEHKNLLLEEYVDCLHFILSIGNDIKISNVHATNYSSPPPKFTQNEITIQFALIYKAAADLMFSQGEVTELNYRILWVRFELLGRMLGFSTEQIEVAYWEKYEINKLRQVNGY